MRNNKFIKRLSSWKSIATMLGIYAALITLGPYVNPGVSHGKNILFSLIIVIPVTLAQGLWDIYSKKA